MKAGTGIVPSKLPGGRDVLGAYIIPQVKNKMLEAYKRGNTEEAEFYEDFLNKLTQLYQNMKDKD